MENKIAMLTGDIGLRTIISFFAMLSGAWAQTLRPWPAEAVAESYEVRVTGATNYASPHFVIESEIKLPLGVVRDLAAVFEATRVAVRTVPLGFGAAPEPPHYRVRLLQSAASYVEAGGSTGSGGSFNGREMLILLPNLGIQPTTNGLSAEHQQHLFVLKHEVTHQIIGRQRANLPMWLDEGLAETFAATPYVRGRYTFTGLDSAMHDYLLKWRRARDSRALRLIAPPRLMSLTRSDWQSEVSAQHAYDLYNSAALLTHWFLHHDTRGNIVAYLDALRHGTSPAEAEAQRLLAGRTREQLTLELRALARRMGLDLVVE
jgi:hypothetical protein